MIKPKSVAYYFRNEVGGISAVSKNAVTRLQKKIQSRSKDFLKAGQVYSMPSHKTNRKIKFLMESFVPPSRKWFRLKTKKIKKGIDHMEANNV